VDAALEKRQVKRAYKIYAPAYDFVFDWIFHPGREQAIRLLDLQRRDHVLEVGIGTGLNLPLYPGHCRITGIDLSEEMLEKAQDKVVELALSSVTLKAMDATVMDFGDSEFDAAVATYTISAVPDPVGVLREMRRVVKPAAISSCSTTSAAIAAWWAGWKTSCRRCAPAWAGSRTCPSSPSSSRSA
jgi:phosphatidylethanolamine/phosphatidyl-N-methylethanolamine N-methyltransferase